MENDNGFEKWWKENKDSVQAHFYAIFAGNVKGMRLLIASQQKRLEQVHKQLAKLSVELDIKYPPDDRFDR